jgi:phosphohistidine swiveling domain-containing protein
MTETVTFTPPGPGAWELEAGHHGRRPLSRYIAETYVRGFEEGSRELTARYGLPLERIRGELVEGCTYVRPVGVGEGDKPGPALPVFLMKVLARVHPELRRRNRTAQRAFETKQWRRDVDQWFDVDREQVVSANLEFQSVALGALDDDALIAHLANVLAHFEKQAYANIANHGGDLIPIGDYLAHCAEWGINFRDASALLQGSSPASTATAELLKPAALAIEAAATPPASIDAVRALTPEARAAVDAWCEQHAWRVVTTDDIDRPTLAERPNAQFAALLAATAEANRREPPDPSALRARVPEGERSLFDELLTEARYGLRQRDDVVGTRWNWSTGLVRRALLEAGRRLSDRSLVAKVDHVFECTPDEVAALLVDGRGPSATELAARADRRDVVQAAGAPDLLGDPEPPPPLAALPKPMARVTAAVLTCLEADLANAEHDALHGTGIGTESYVGRARIANDVDDALERLEPGDVLIAPFTGPAYNSLFPILGALVVEYGGAMCHAAIVAREFGLPAVIGASGATTDIADGAQVEVDPVAGVVRVLA